jgi:hypothetical protein
MLSQLQRRQQLVNVLTELALKRRLGVAVSGASEEPEEGSHASTGAGQDGQGVGAGAGWEA